MLKLEARAEPSRVWTYGSPLLALLVTVLIGALMFTALGKRPAQGPGDVFLAAHPQRLRPG